MLTFTYVRWICVCVTMDSSVSRQSRGKHWRQKVNASADAHVQWFKCSMLASINSTATRFIYSASFQDVGTCSCLTAANLSPTATTISVSTTTTDNLATGPEQTICTGKPNKVWENFFHHSHHKLWPNMIVGSRCLKYWPHSKQLPTHRFFPFLMQEPGSDMTTQFSSMTLTPQHSLTPQSSTESTSDPPGYTPQQPQQVLTRYLHALLCHCIVLPLAFDGHVCKETITIDCCVSGPLL